MPIPLRELVLVILLVPAAFGLEAACRHADLEWEAASIGQTCSARHLHTRGLLVDRSACTEESMIIAWDIQLQMQAERQARSAIPPGEPVAYDRPSL